MADASHIAIVTIVLSFIADIISKNKATKASVEVTKKLAEVVEELKNTVAAHGARLDRLEDGKWNT